MDENDADEAAEAEEVEEEDTAGGKRSGVSRKGLREKLLAFLTLFGLFKRPQNLPQSDRLKEIYYRY